MKQFGSDANPATYEYTDFVGISKQDDRPANSVVNGYKQFEQKELYEALLALYEENLEYSNINHLRAHNNFVMRKARKALGMPEWIEIRYK